MHEKEEGLVFAEVPLLFECGMTRSFDSVWVVSASEETQISRLHERNGLSRAQALQRIRSQIPLSEKADAADHVIITDGTINETHMQVDRLIVLMKATPASVARRSGKIRQIRAEVSANGNPTVPHQVRLSSCLYSPLIILASLCMLVYSIYAVRDYTSAQKMRYELETQASEKTFYPLYYKNLITSYSQQYGLDPALTASVILCESEFHSSAVSRLGARGLMQLMEETAEWIARSLGEHDASYSFDLLFDPETNIRFGTWYLHYLSSIFDKDPVKIVCAYHAGQGNVASWLRNPKFSSDGQTLDSIPTEDTANYCKRVFAAKAVYEHYCDY